MTGLPVCEFGARLMTSTMAVFAFSADFMCATTYAAVRTFGWLRAWGAYVVACPLSAATPAAATTAAAAPAISTVLACRLPGRGLAGDPARSSKSVRMAVSRRSSKRASLGASVFN